MTEMYNPNGAGFHNKLPMKSIDRLKELDSIEDIHRYKIDLGYGVYYPLRHAPGKDHIVDSEMPVIMPAGSIVSIIPINAKAAYTEDDAETGILEDGEMYISIDATGTKVKKPIDFLYGGDVAGFITLANGGNEATDSYSDTDGEYGILTMSGDVADSDDTFVRPANKPVGITASKVLADLKYRYLNYEVDQKGYVILPAGVITLPVAIVFGSGDRDSVLTAIEKAVGGKHVYVHVDAETEAAARALIGQSALLMPDKNGKFTQYDEVDSAQIFGKVLEHRVRIPYDTTPYEDSFPGSQIPGMDTAGLPKRLFNFLDSIMTNTTIKPASGWTYSKENLKKLLYDKVDTNVADVSIAFSNVDIAFGYLAK